MNKLLICNARSEVEEQACSFGEYIKNEKPETQEMFGFGPLSKEKK